MANPRPPMAPRAVPTTEGGNEHGCYVALGLTAAPGCKERALATAARGGCRRTRRRRGSRTPGGAASGIGGDGLRRGQGLLLDGSRDEGGRGNGVVERRVHRQGRR